MTTARKAALWSGASVAIVVATAGITSNLLDSQSLPITSILQATTTPAQTCKTIATDPNPPLNVRSSPVVAPDNVIGKLRNGTPMTVVDEKEGWLRINSPLEGWVFKQLTITSCVSSAIVVQSTPTETDHGSMILEQAAEYYHTGDLETAIALAQTVPPNSAAYQPAGKVIIQWEKDWERAETQFQAAQKALDQGQWQEVLNQVQAFPDNRFWREKLTPVVRRAIRQPQSN